MPENNDNRLDSILAIVRQFMESRILLSAAELNLFTYLNGVSSTAENLAARLHADVRGLNILLDALVAMDLLLKQGDKYQCTTDAALFLTENSSLSALPMICHMAFLWQKWSNLTAKIKESRLNDYRTSIDCEADEIHAFIGAMHVAGMTLARKIVSAIEHGQTRNLIDVGGASGTYTIAFLEDVPEMKATIFDRPAVIPIARKRLIEKGMQDRVHLVEGDFYTDELPGGHDLALLSAIIHQNSPSENIALFCKVQRALLSGGRIIIRDYVMATDRTKPKDGAIFAVNMLINTKGGSTYTFDEIKDWLKKAGFTKVRQLKFGEHMDALVEAFKP